MKEKFGYMQHLDIKQLQGSPAWQAFEYKVKGVAKSLDSLEGIPFNDPVAGAIEGRARQLAKEKIEEIFEPFISSFDEDVERMADVLDKAGL